MRKILAMLLSVMLLLTAAVAETSAPYAPETVLPLVANNRPYRDFARGAISSSEDAIECFHAHLWSLISYASKIFLLPQSTLRIYLTKPFLLLYS